MAEGKLTTAVVGLDERGQGILQSLARLEEAFEIAAVADADGDAAQKAGKRYGASGYDDLRQMLIQKELDLIISAGPLHGSIEHLQAAMRKGCHILRCPPAARSFGEAAELFKIAEENEVTFSVARPWRRRRGFAAMKRYLEQNTDEQFYLVEAWCSSAQRTDINDWQKDPQLAGGGVVLNLCYPLIDQITTLFSSPQQVYALCTNLAPDRTQRQALTEDTAAVSMRFDDRLIGKIVASRTLWPGGWLIRAHGKNCHLTLNERGFSARDSDGALLQRPGRRDNEELLVDQMLRELAEAILAGDYRPFEKEASETLGSMALIQAAYLSDKTGMPEEPRRIVEMTGG